MLEVVGQGGAVQTGLLCPLSAHPLPCRPKGWIHTLPDFRGALLWGPAPCSTTDCRS